MTTDRRTTGRPSGSGAAILLGAALVVLLALVVVVGGMWMGGRPDPVAGTTLAGPAIIQAPADDSSATTAVDRDAASVKAQATRVRDAAREDAEALSAAHETASAAGADLATTVAIVRAHHARVSGPVHDLVTAHPEAFTPDVVDVLSAVVDLTTTHLTDAVAEVDHGELEVGRSAGGAEASTTPAHLSPTITDHEEALEEHYRGLGDDELRTARAEVRRAVDRLTAAAEADASATLILRGHVQGLDETLVGVLLAAESVGSATVQGLSHSSQETAQDFATAVAELSRLSGAQVDGASGQARSVEQPTVLVGVLDAVETYLVTERTARASHDLRGPGPDESVDPDPGGNGGAGYACYQWNLYGGYVGWCYDD